MTENIRKAIAEKVREELADTMKWCSREKLCASAYWVATVRHMIGRFAFEMYYKYELTETDVDEIYKMVIA